MILLEFYQQFLSSLPVIPVDFYLSRILFSLFLFALGACFGSFFNVCIYRLPIQKSIISPGSYCFSCQKPIAFYNNIPLFSYIFLKGRCRNCHASYSSRYFWVEALTGFLFVISFLMNYFTLDILLIRNLVFVSFGIIIFFIDLDHKIIPDKLSLPLTLIGLFFAILGTISLKSSIIGGLFGFVVFYGIAWLFWKSRGIEGLGGGDIKYISAVGTFLGFSGVLFVIFFSSFFAIVCSAIFRRKNFDQEFPFGPYLVFSAFVYLLFGDAFIRWYLGLFLQHL